MSNIVNRGDRIHKNWSTLIKPSEYSVTVHSAHKSSFILKPLERGFGVTIGNALMRILLSSLRGVKPIAVNIKGVPHQYSTINGMTEDVMDLILNIKSLIIDSGSVERKRLSLKAVGPCQVLAQSIDTPAGVNIVNKNLKLCTLANGSSVDLEIIIDSGKGYVPASSHTRIPNEIGWIALDSMFSPVKRAIYTVGSSRVGGETEYDKLTMTIETDGGLSPEMALGIAAKILQDQLSVFITFDDKNIEEQSEKKLPFDKKLLTRISALELSVRSYNCLRNQNIMYLGDLVTLTEAMLLRMPNFGRKSLNEIKLLLEIRKLNLGMTVPEWPPQNVEELSSMYENELDGEFDEEGHENYKKMMAVVQKRSENDE